MCFHEMKLDALFFHDMKRTRNTIGTQQSFISPNRPAHRN